MVELSIIVPVYNSVHYLKKCVDSILNQTFHNFELILVDDASNDGSEIICDEYKMKDERVKVIHHVNNKGLSVSREDGYGQAIGDWIAFVDNDDLLSPYLYEALISKKHDGDIICARGEDKSTEEIEQAVFCWNHVNSFILSGKDACDKIYSKKLQFGCIGPIWGKIIKRQMIDETLKLVEQYKENLYWVYFEDVLFMPMLFYNAVNVVFIDQLMYMHRHIKNNLSSTLIPKEYHYESAAAGKVVLDFFCEKGLQDAFSQYLEKCLLEVQSNWYKVWRNETDKDKKNQYNQFADDFFSKYYEKYKAEKKNTIGGVLKRVSINLYAKNKRIWAYTVGFGYFYLLRKIIY